MKTSQFGEKGTKHVFSVAQGEPLVERLRMMYLYYGRRGGGAICGACRHFRRANPRQAWATCRLCMTANGFGIDWRASWPGCGAWEEEHGGAG